MPKERIYDAYKQDTLLEIRWTKGDDDMYVIAEEVDPHDSSLVKWAGVALNGPQTDRLIRTLNRVQRQLNDEGPETRTVRAVAVLDGEPKRGDETHEEAFKASAVQKMWPMLVQRAYSDGYESLQSVRAYKLDVDNIDNKSLWQSNQTAYVVELDYEPKD